MLEEANPELVHLEHERVLHFGEDRLGASCFALVAKKQNHVEDVDFALDLGTHVEKVVVDDGLYIRGKPRAHLFFLEDLHVGFQSLFHEYEENKVVFQKVVLQDLFLNQVYHCGRNLVIGVVNAPDELFEENLLLLEMERILVEFSEKEEVVVVLENGEQESQVMEAQKYRNQGFSVQIFVIGKVEEIALAVDWAELKRLLLSL